METFQSIYCGEGFHFTILQNVLKYRNGYSPIKIISAVLNIKDILSIHDKVRVSAYKDVKEIDFTGISK